VQEQRQHSTLMFHDKSKQSDAPFYGQHTKVRIEIHSRDEFDMSIKANTLRFQPILNVKNDEALGVLSAIEWMWDIKFKQVIFSLN
jgi:hypothetical protein